MITYVKWILCVLCAVFGFMAAQSGLFESEPAPSEEKVKQVKSHTIRDAVINGDMRVFLAKSRNKKELEKVDDDGSTLLHLAAQYGRANIAYVLMDMGLDPNARRKDGKKPSDIAEDNDTRLACLYGEDTHAQTLKALHAARNGDMEKLRVALQNGADPLLPTPDDGLPLFFATVENGNFVLVHEMMKMGADPNAMHNGYPVIFHAIWGKRVGVVNHLLRFGANPMLVGRKGMVALHAGMWTHNVDIIKLLLPHYDAFNYNVYTWPDGFPAMIAVDQGDYEAIKTMLEMGMNPNASHFVKEELLLTRAAIKGNEKIVRLLLDYGADPTMKNRAGKNALDVAKPNVIDMIRKAAK